MTDVDEYIVKIIKRGDEGSELLHALCAPTLKNSRHIDVVSGGAGEIAVLRPPEDYNIVAHSATGDPAKLDVAEHTASLMNRLYADAQLMNATPLALVDVVDSSEGLRETLRTIGDTLVAKANENKIAVINGELAILGYRVNCEANVSGTMIGIVPDSVAPGVYERNGVTYVVFDPKGKAVHGNADGIGTRTEFDERLGNYPRTLRNSLAMKLDDSSKSGARAKAVFDIIESSGQIEIPIELMNAEAKLLGKDMGFEYVLVHEFAGDRLRGWKEGATALNVSGSAVTVIDEERLCNPLAPSAGEYIVAIRGKPNPRSNGITDKRKAMVATLGNSWHETPIGKIFMEFLAEPSTVFYPVFNQLIDQGLATSVYHMSGGAYNGKLAKPLAKHGLYAPLEGLYAPDWRELGLARFMSTSAEAAYAKWPMGNEGFITTRNPAEAIEVIKKYGLEAKQVGIVEKAKDGRTGIELVGIRGSDGNNVYFSGQENKAA